MSLHMIQFLSSGECIAVNTTDNSCTVPLHHSDRNHDLRSYNYDESIDLQNLTEGVDYKVIRTA